MALVMIALFVSAVLIMAAGALARSRLGFGGAGALSGLTCLFALALFSLPVAVHALLTSLGAIVCAKMRATAKTFTWMAAGAAVPGYALTFALSLAELRERRELREEFPLVSIEERLTYEDKAPGAIPKAKNPEDDGRQEPTELSPEVQERLVELERRPSRSMMRRYMLRSVHDRARDQFVAARGFGPVRMPNVSRESVELPEPEPIPVAPPPEPARERPYPSEAPQDGRAPARAASRPTYDDLLTMHEFGTYDFLDPARMGYVKDRQHVAGFQPHHFRKRVRLREEDPEWQVTRLELISLLKHEEPVAYVSDHLPRMDELKDAPTRPLTAFERRALGRLRSERDLVVEEGLNLIRMVGSLRAGEDCLQCHSVERGALLGAFSYDLHRVEPIPEGDAEPEPRAQLPAVGNVFARFASPGARFRRARRSVRSR